MERLKICIFVSLQSLALGFYYLLCPCRNTQGPFGLEIGLLPEDTTGDYRPNCFSREALTAESSRVQNREFPKWTSRRKRCLLKDKE